MYELLLSCGECFLSFIGGRVAEDFVEAGLRSKLWGFPHSNERELWVEVT
ncbi:MAG: hypothetical protein ACK416_00855 [Zestosphaera sp.]